MNTYTAARAANKDLAAPFFGAVINALSCTLKIEIHHIDEKMLAWAFSDTDSGSDGCRTVGGFLLLRLIVTVSTAHASATQQQHNEADEQREEDAEYEAHEEAEH